MVPVSARRRYSLVMDRESELLGRARPQEAPLQALTEALRRDRALLPAWHSERRRRCPNGA